MTLFSSPMDFNNHELAFVAGLLQKYAMSGMATLEELAQIHTFCVKVETLLDMGEQYEKRENLIKDVGDIWNEKPDSDTY